ncbi:MAG: hypothetical protein KDD45_13095, partial [Bdellovibrionales bacterium]|nr:hypothetical protein [Bdellovibrionales bacterium]
MIRWVFVLFFVSFFSEIVFAQTKLPSGIEPEVIGVQTKIESWITERMKRVVSTTLEEKAYKISTQVQVRKKKLEGKTSELPFDMQLGWLDNEEFSSNRPQFELPSLTDSPLENFEITSIEISLGLSEKLDVEYVKKMESWLNKRVRNDFGPKAKAKVSTIGSLPEEKTVEAKKETKKWEDYLKDYQYLLGFL